MSSRETILAAVAANQPNRTELPDIQVFENNKEASVQQFVEMVKTVGGKAVLVAGMDEIWNLIKKQYGENIKMVSPIAQLKKISNYPVNVSSSTPAFHDVDIAILKGDFGVAENGAIWITEDDMVARVLPFICQHLIIILDKNSILNTMHDAYKRIDSTSYGFGTFIAGPSKTADIEQSLVIGAHGPRSVTIYLVDPMI